MARLSSIDPADRLVATRALKNESIVNPRRKLTLLRAGAVPALLSQLVQGPSPKQATQSLSALASLLLVQQGCACLVEEGGTDVLLMALCSQDAGVAAASASALRALCVHAPLRDLPPACCSALCRLVAQAGADSVAPAHVMAAVAGSPGPARALVAAGAVPHLAGLLGMRGAGLARTPVLQALAGLAAGDPEAARQLAAAKPAVDALALAARNGAEVAASRYNAAACLLYCCPVLQERRGEAEKQALVCRGFCGLGWGGVCGGGKAESAPPPFQSVSMACGLFHSMEVPLGRHDHPIVARVKCHAVHVPAPDPAPLPGPIPQSLRCCVLSTLVALLDCKEPLGCERALLLLLGTDASLLAAAVDAGAVARLAGKVARCDCPPQHLVSMVLGLVVVLLGVWEL